MKLSQKIILSILICLQFSFLGCSGLPAGSDVIGEDAIQGEQATSFSKMWQSAFRVANIMGSLHSEDRENGVIRFDVNSTMVTVKVEQLALDKVQLHVSARKYLTPNLKMAKKVYKKIIDALSQ